MISVHPDEDALEQYALASSDPSASEAVRSHVAACAECRETVETILRVERELSHPETWAAIREPEPPQVPEALMRRIESQRIEDQIAEYLVEPLLANPEGIERMVLELDGRYRSAGVIRRLLQASDQARETVPARALAFANAAVVLAEQVPADRYEPDFIASLRGSAWRDRANSLRFLGRYPEALDAIDRAETAFRSTTLNEVDLARVDYVRATILWKMESWNEALPLSRGAGSVFHTYGETDRELGVGLVEGGILFDTKQYTLAAEKFSSLLTIGEKIKSVTLGYLYSALAAAKQERGDLQAAAPLFQEAMAQFEYFGLEIEKLRTNWSLARLSVQLGNTAAAIRQLAETATGFAACGSLADSSLVTLDLVEQHIQAGHAGEAASLCRTLPERFSAAGMTTSALTALEYLRDAAAAGPVTTREISYVRAFLHRLPAEPHLAFAPPPPA